MLLYNPAFDIHHCIYRILTILYEVGNAEIDIERLQIIDFYMLFPEEILNIKHTIKSQSIKKHFEKNVNIYNSTRDSNRLIFLKTMFFQNLALKYLISYGFVDSDLFKKNKIKRTTKELPLNLILSIKKTLSEEPNIRIIINLIFKTFADIPIYGEKGLKARTNLIEYKYDVHESNFDN
jgi:hypothetical protein